MITAAGEILIVPRSFAFPGTAFLPVTVFSFPRVFFSLSETLGKVQSEVLPVTLSDELAGVLQARFCITLHRSPLCPRQLDLKSAPVKGNENIAGLQKHHQLFKDFSVRGILLCLSVLIRVLRSITLDTLSFVLRKREKGRDKQKLKFYTFFNYYILLNPRICGIFRFKKHERYISVCIFLTFQVIQYTCTQC